VESMRERQPPEATPFCTASAGSLARRQQRQRQRQQHPSAATKPSGAASHKAQRAPQSIWLGKVRGVAQGSGWCISVRVRVRVGARLGSGFELAPQLTSAV